MSLSFSALNLRRKRQACTKHSKTLSDPITHLSGRLDCDYCWTTAKSHAVNWSPEEQKNLCAILTTEEIGRESKSLRTHIHLISHQQQHKIEPVQKIIKVLLQLIIIIKEKGSVAVQYWTFHKHTKANCTMRKRRHIFTSLAEEQKEYFPQAEAIKKGRGEHMVSGG